MAIIGLRGTGDWGTDERPKNFREMILWRQPNGQSPLTALLSRIASEKTDDPEFAWWEEQLDSVRVQETAGLTNSGTSMTFASGGDALVPGDLLLVEKADQTTYDNEIVEVSAATATSATIIRAAAGTTAATIPINSFLTKIGNVYGEGTNSPTATTRNPGKKFNYCQIFKTSYELTETAKITKARTGDPLKNDKKRKMFDHSVAMEWAFLLGRKSEVAGSNGKPKRTTAGLRSFLTTNVTIFGGGGPTLGEDTFINAISPVFNYASGAGDERLILCGNAAMTKINRLARDSASSRINHTETVKLYGMNLQRWIMPQGAVYMKTHPLLNAHPVYSKSMFVIDPSQLKYRFQRDTKPMDNIQANDADTEKGQWLSECGLEVHHEMTMAYLGNVA